ncbi:hypothetical protein [Phenylobacterium sp. SCN 70-31]|uniref:hypothetical protein n=1 Tax=Phenylobacterium sp. SCN 70-31 TaxID=1660129 RepID=UPI00086F3FED|nr:hypothetical protein [Phenylobacterium sp. SCN 70-31]ODT89595.1 MAG: hypothetical protein ABS78_01865 [Phenylobacterium sp. SCN 70-31]
MRSVVPNGALRATSRAALGLILAGGVAGAALAADFVVVASTDPAVKPGVEFSGGERIALGAGQTARLMSASGAITTVRGGPQGAVAPRPGAATDPSRLAQLKILVDPPPTSRTFGARRSGVCPDPAHLTTLDHILAAQKAGCANQARTALQALVSAEPTP